MKFAHSFVFSHSCRCVLVYSFHRPALMPTAHLAHRAAACYNKCNDLFITFYIQEVPSMRIAYETILCE